MSYFTAADLEINTERVATLRHQLAQAEAVQLEILHDVREAEAAEAKKSLPETRFAEAMKTLRQDGVKVRRNVKKCCRGCIVESDLGLEEDSKTPYGYTYGGQGMAAKWDERGEHMVRFTKERGYYGSSSTETQLYFNHGNGAGNKIAAAFRAAGFEVEYKADSESACVVVTIP